MLGRYATMELQCLFKLFLKSHIIHGFIKYFEKNNKLWSSGYFISTLNDKMWWHPGTSNKYFCGSSGHKLCFEASTQTIMCNSSLGLIQWPLVLPWLDTYMISGCIWWGKKWKVPLSSSQADTKLILLAFIVDSSQLPPPLSPSLFLSAARTIEAP